MTTDFQIVEQPDGTYKVTSTEVREEVLDTEESFEAYLETQIQKKRKLLDIEVTVDEETGEEVESDPVIEVSSNFHIERLTRAIERLTIDRQKLIDELVAVEKPKREKALLELQKLKEAKDKLKKVKKNK